MNSVGTTEDNVGSADSSVTEDDEVDVGPVGGTVSGSLGVVADSSAGEAAAATGMTSGVTAGVSTTLGSPGTSGAGASVSTGLGLGAAALLPLGQRCFATYSKPWRRLPPSGL